MLLCIFKKCIVKLKSPNRRKGFAKQALVSLIKYAWNELRLKQLHTGIFSDNKSSLALFKSVGFQKVRKNNYVLYR